IGTVVIPNGLLLLLTVLPLLGYGRMRSFGHATGIVVVGLIAVGVVALTGLAISADHAKTEAAQKFREELEAADVLAHRSVQIAADGIPAEGPVLLLRRDPFTEGKRLFGQHCATCHIYGDEFENKKPTASNLENFASQDWIRGLLANPASPDYFGHTKLRRMNNWVDTTRSKARKDGKETDLEKEFDDIAGWLASQPGRDRRTDLKSVPAAGF